MAKRGLSSRLRHRVDLLRATQVKKATGGYETTFPPIATDVAAEVLMLSGSEAVKEKILAGIRVYRITLRWRADVLQTDQVRYDGEVLNIRSAIDPDNRRAELVIHADTESTLRG